MQNRRLIAFFVVASILSIGAWAILRYEIEARLSNAAQRDLLTIIDLVAATVMVAGQDAPSIHGPALLKISSSELVEMAKILDRVGDQQLRTVYFFDDAGRLLRLARQAEGGAVRGGPSPIIVQEALEARQRDASLTQGARFHAYAGLPGGESVGAWRWLPELGLGIIAERPYDRFVRPLRWLDVGLVAILVALLLGFLFVARIGTVALRTAFNRPDITRCGPYVIERLIGEGAMCNVYLARHRHLNRRVAVKRLKAQANRDELAARFTREARIASQLAHPHIVAIYDYGSMPDGGFYYAMEYIHGLTLTQWVEQHGPVPPARTVYMLLQICAAVGHMHQNQLLHRDIKPDNIMAFAKDGTFDQVKLLDFGLIKDLDNGGSRDLTRTLRVLGTPAFMAPERMLDPRCIDKRSDLYGIGCVGFYLLTGRKPFEATSDGDLAQQVLHIDAPLASTLAVFPVPTALDRLIASCLAKDMSKRPPNASAFIETLEEIAQVIPWHPETAMLWWTSLFPIQVKE